MKLIRALCFAVLAATLVGFGIASSVPAADTPKTKLEEKKEMRLKLKAALAKKQTNAENRRLPQQLSNRTTRTKRRPNRSSSRLPNR